MQEFWIKTETGLHILDNGIQKQDIMEQYRVNRVWVDDAHICAEIQNFWSANFSFSRCSRLANATPFQRKSFVLSRYGIHWPELDEDLCFEGLFADAGIYKPSNAEDTIYYQA